MEKEQRNRKFVDIWKQHGKDVTEAGFCIGIAPEVLRDLLDGIIDIDNLTAKCIASMALYFGCSIDDLLNTVPTTDGYRYGVYREIGYEWITDDGGADDNGNRNEREGIEPDGNNITDSPGTDNAKENVRDNNKGVRLQILDGDKIHILNPADGYVSVPCDYRERAEMLIDWYIIQKRIKLRRDKEITAYEEIIRDKTEYTRKLTKMFVSENPWIHESEFHVLSWNEPLSAYGEYIGESVIESTTSGLYGWKRIAYIGMDGDIHYADPYKPGYIIVKTGEGVIFEMYANEGETKMSVIISNGRNDEIRTVTEKYGNIIGTAFCPYGNGPITRLHRTADAEAYEWLLKFDGWV